MSLLSQEICGSRRDDAPKTIYVRLEPILLRLSAHREYLVVLSMCLPSAPNIS